MSVVINTTKTKDRFAKLLISDLESISAFSAWIKKVLIVPSSAPVSNEHLSIYLSYIKDRINDYDDIDSMAWKKSILGLENKMGDNNEF
jgi:hypothetical protein